LQKWSISANIWHLSTLPMLKQKSSPKLSFTYLKNYLNARIGSQRFLVNQSF